MIRNKTGILSLVFFLFITIAPAGNSYALIISNAEIQYINCEGICFEPGLTFTFNRDNTGNGQESNGIIITDGQGNVIYTDGGLNTVPGSTTIPGPWCFTYNTAPQYNPITVQLVSAAGNGYSTQIAYQTTGTCEGLIYATAIPTMTEWGMIVFIILAALGSVYCIARKRKA